MEFVVTRATIYRAWRDEPWVVEGAAVRVALVCFSSSSQPLIALDGVGVDKIGPDLRSGHVALRPRPLATNSGVSFIGTQKNGPFDVEGELARNWVQTGFNPNGRPNSEVLKPWANGSALVRRSEDRWIIDFGSAMPQEEAALYELPFAHVDAHVRPTRLHLRRDWHRTKWWLHGDPRPAMRRALRGLGRQILTPRVSKYRLFVWAPTAVLADSAVVCIARDDDCTFGVLQSKWHELWALRLGTWLGVGNDPRYTPSTTFETFPFPEGLTPDIPPSEYAADPRAVAIATAAKRLNDLRENWLNPPELVRREAEVVPGLPDRILPVDDNSAEVLKGRTLTKLYNERPAWLLLAHKALDAAVAASYGWPADLSDEDMLARLFALNNERAGSSAAAPEPEPEEA
jgi:type II restriction/modification system DNA methylase subunit YeeA